MAKTNFEDQIKNYGNEIKKLKDPIQAVRTIPGNFLEYGDTRAVINMIREIFQNAIDEICKTNSPANWCSVSYSEITHETIIVDNGRSIPKQHMIDIFSSEYTSSNYEKKPFEYSSGVHGEGSLVVNALSEYFIVESYIMGKAYKVEFHEGYPWKKGIIEIPNKNNQQGTIVRFKPYKGLGEITTSIDQVFMLVYTILPLTPIGTVIDFHGVKADGTVINEHLVNEDGIVANLIMKTDKPLIKPVIISNDTGYMKADIAFTYDTSDMSGVEDITAFANMSPNKLHGTHVDGFLDGLIRYFRNYMNKIYLATAKNNKIVVNANDIKTGLKAIVTSAHLHPVFSSQAKDRLTNDDMRTFVSELVYNALGEWSKANPQDLTKLCKYLKDVAELRTKTDDSKVKLSNSYQQSALSSMPKKYVKPTGNKHLELHIVEGDSAKGSVTNGRDAAYQGVFPIRGKIINAFSTTPAKFLANEEVASIITIIGGGYGKKFDLSKVKWEKIIFDTDADSDGFHIKSLLLRFFLLYMKPLIEDGRVYGSVPPLYGLEYKKGKFKYFTEKIDYVKYCQKLFSEKNSLSIDKNPLKTNQVVELLYRNIEYVYNVEVVANRYAIPPQLLEQVLFLTDAGVDMKTMQKQLKRNYRFLEFENKSTPIIKGLVGDKYVTIFLNDKLIGECSEILKLIRNNMHLYYTVNGEKMSLYQIMKLFESVQPNNITRYKGLGEMNEAQLYDSTLCPENRTLIRYTVDDIVKEIEAIRVYENDKSALLKDIKVSRSDIL